MDAILYQNNSEIALVDVTWSQLCLEVSSAMFTLLMFQVMNVDTMVLLKDTTGVLLAVASEEVPESSCYVGVILGTGTNACYMEKFDAATIPKFKGDSGGHSHVIVDCEWGAFCGLENLMSPYDKQLDEMTSNRGQHL